MDTDFLLCERCQTILTGEMVNTPRPRPCPGCGTSLLTRVFPAFFHPPASQAHPSGQEAAASDEDASCFFHPRKKAVVDCANCGRFLCALCDLDVDGRHLCPTCVENSRGKGDATDKSFVREHYRYDYLASNLVVYALIPAIWFVSLVTAPLALYYVVRYWNSPRTAMIPRGHGRQIVAAILAVLQITAWLLFFAYSFFVAPDAANRPNRLPRTTHGNR